MDLYFRNGLHASEEIDPGIEFTNASAGRSLRSIPESARNSLINSALSPRGFVGALVGSPSRRLRCLLLSAYTINAGPLSVF